MENIQQPLLPIKYTNEDCFMQENDKYGQGIQISDFKSLCAFEMRTPVIIGLRIVVATIVLICVFIRRLLCARYCSNYFTYINSLNFQGPP